jgi:alpha-beta hydrolase superfamily lysophospholipase
VEAPSSQKCSRRASLAVVVGLAASLSVPAVRATAAPAERDAAATVPRPRVVETTFKSVDAVVAAQWDFPKNTPAPLVVLIPAGGRLDRNGWNPGLGENADDGIYARLADQLVEAGFAVFRYDKPGTGRSSRGAYATERSTALEGYTRAVDHARVDTSHVFLLGHASGTDAVAGIYSRYAAVVPPAGVIMLANSVGESASLAVKAPLLIVNGGKDPDDRYQYGSYVVEARRDAPGGPLPTDLVIIDGASHGLLATEPDGSKSVKSLDPVAVKAVIDWLRRHRGLDAS